MKNKRDILRDKKFCNDYLDSLAFFCRRDWGSKAFSIIMEELTDELRRSCFEDLVRVQVFVNNFNSEDNFRAQYDFEKKTIEYSFSKLIKPAYEKINNAVYKSPRLLKELVNIVLHELTHCWEEKVCGCYKHKTNSELGYHCPTFFWKLYDLKISPEETLKKYPQAKPIWNKITHGWNPTLISEDAWDVLYKNRTPVNCASIAKLYDFLKEGTEISDKAWKHLEDNLRSRFIFYLEIVGTLAQYLPFERLLPVIADLRHGKDLDFFLDEARRFIPVEVVRRHLLLLGEEKVKYKAVSDSVGDDEECSVDAGDIYIENLILTDSDYKNLFKKLISIYKSLFVKSKFAHFSI